MKLYIITTNLNAENILATECVSPFSICERRDYGYRTFYSVGGWERKECVLLFSQIPNVTINDTERENHPMVVEIEDDSQQLTKNLVTERQGCYVYACHETIRITPANCRLLFFSVKAKALTATNCCDSALCKLVNYYKFDVVAPSKFRIEELVADLDSTVQSEDCDSIDNRLDKIKGGVFGFAMGAMRSIKPNTAQLLKIQKRVYDIAATARSNSGTLNKGFVDELERLDAEYRGNDFNVNMLQELWAKRSPAVTEAFLKELGLEAEAKRRFAANNKIPLRLSISACNGDWERYSQDLLVYTDKLIAKDWEKSETGFSLSESIIIDDKTASLKETDKNASLFNKILSEMVSQGIALTADELRVNRSEITTEVVKCVKRIIGEEHWDGSQEQLFFHHLRMNVINGEPFDIAESNNIVWQSLAAFLLKGEDYEELTSYAAFCSLGDLRYMLGLWGATIGYVQIPRTVTAKFGESRFARLHSAVQKLMFGVEVSYERTEGKTIKQSDISVQPKTPSTPNLSLKERVMRWFIQKRVQNREQALASLNSVFNQLGDNPNNLAFVGLLNDFQGWKKSNGAPNKLWEDLCREFAPDYNKQTGTTKTESVVSKIGNAEYSLFGNNSSFQSELCTVLTDSSWHDKTANMITDANAQKQYLRDIRWFVSEYDNPKSKYNSVSKYNPQGDACKHNGVVIEHLRNLLAGKRKNSNNSNNSAENLYNFVPIEQIITYLREHYPDA